MVDHLDLHKPLSQEDFTSLVVAVAETPLMEVPGVEAVQKPNQQSPGTSNTGGGGAGGPGGLGAPGGDGGSGIVFIAYTTPA